MPATATYNLTGNAYIDGVLGGMKWAVNSLTFSFPTSPSFYEAGYGDGEPTNNFGALNATQQSAARLALGMYGAVANLAFTEITETSSQHGDLRFAMSDAPSTAWAYFPSPAPEGGDVWFNKSGGYYTSPQRGNYAYATFMHETGHALGLDHPHEGNVMPADRDSMEYTVMSYRSYVGASTTTGYTNETWGYAQSPMMYDIAAVQHMYGANFSTYSGNTTYTWSPTTGEMFINGVGQGAPGANRIFLTVWDGGGIDTYDFSNYETALTVDLRPGAWTTTSSAQLARLHYDGSRLAAGNIANAVLYNNDGRSLVENATGGSGDDIIVGNHAGNVLVGAAGNDTLTGGAGDDVIDGGTGTDTAVFSGTRSQYSATQLQDGFLQIRDFRDGSPTGTDLLRNVELFAFSDRTYTSGELLASVEPREVLYTDSANQFSWNSYTNFYNTQGLLYLQRGLYDDGSTWRGDWDLVNAASWNTISHTYDTLGRLFHQQGTYDDGTTWISDSDLANSASWTVISYAYDTFGRLYHQQGMYDNGTTWVSDWDVNNTASWSSINYSYDTAGRLFHQNGTTDAGGEWTSDWDVASTATWSVITRTFTQGMLTSETTIYDDGRITVVGSAAPDTLFGDAAPNELFGRGGDDQLYGGAGNDVLDGGDGNDALYGGLGADLLTGGNGNDLFVFQTAADSASTEWDTITDFVSGSDRIDLHNIDANIQTPGHQMFNFIGAADFTGTAGELSFVRGFLQGDTNGDGYPDFRINISQLSSIYEFDLYL